MLRTNGPGKFFADNPIAYAVSLLGAGTAVCIFAYRAVVSRGPRRPGWALLSALEASIFIGMVVATEEARRHRGR